jgi:glycosyltransferase involved in cell wall biosynthesis
LKASVLFAGRPNAKGLNQVIKAVADSGWHLHLAGPNRLNEIAALSLDSSQYTFHGQLHREDLLSLIHRVKLVAVLSECFDVFPTVTLESLRHGTLVITTRTTGNADLVRNISKDLIVEYQAVPSLIRLEYVLKDLSKNNILEELSDLITVNESFHRYSVHLRID